MTPEEFEKLVVEGKAMKLAEAVESLDESQRRKLSKTASELLKEIRRGARWWGEGDPPKTPILDRVQGKPRRWSRNDRSLHHLQGVAELGVLAVGPLSQAKKIAASDYGDNVTAFRKVLLDRRPEWIAEWVEAKLEGEFPEIGWETLRALITEGVCPKPTFDGYARLMASGIYRWNDDGKTLLSQKLLAEPDLLEDIWRFFEVETDAFLYEDTPYRKDIQGWGAALVELAGKGHIDRQRLLDGSLSGLTTGFKNNTLSGYIRLFETLEPTPEELASRQQTLVDLLSSQVSHVVTFAVKMLGSIEKARRLDGEAFLTSAGVVFSLRPKSQPKAVLKLARRVAKRQPELVPWALNTATEGLAHEAADVQELAVELIEGWASRAHADHAASLRERFDDLAPTLRGRIEKLLREMGEEGVAETDDAEIAELSSLVDQARTIDPRWAKPAGVDAAVEAIQPGAMPGPLEFDLYDAPVLTGADPIEPIETVDELLDAVAHALESVDSGDEVERIVDGISRLCDRRPEDFKQRADPLIKRLLKTQTGSGTAQGLAAAWGAPFSLPQLLHSWLGGKGLSKPHHRKAVGRGIWRFIDHRLKEIVVRVQKGLAAPMLAAPTHSGGWIDPRVLVERLATLEQKKIQPPGADLIAAMLRMAPEQRREALEAAKDISGTAGNAVHWALGGEPDPTKRDRKSAALWLAAGRARSPHGRIEKLTILRLGEDIPDAVTPATYTWKPSERIVEDSFYKKTYHIPQMTVAVHPACRGADPLHPTVALHDKVDRWANFGSPWTLQWLATTWPQNMDPYLRAGVEALMYRFDDPSSSFEPYYVFLEPLLARDRPWSELACLAAWVGLLSKDADARGLALDVLIEAIEDGRAHPDPMGKVLARLLSTGWARLNRLAEGLAEVARLSPLHAWFAAESLQPLVASYRTFPRDAHHVLSLLQQLLTDLNLAPNDDVRHVLEPVKGSTKTAKAARGIVALKGNANSPKIQQAQAQSLQARIARAERWSCGSAPTSASQTPQV